MSRTGSVPLRVLHTADWQLGLRLDFVAGETAARLRAQRYDTVRAIAQLAHARGVDLVVVAGDVFDANRVGRDTLQQASDALATFGALPVVLLAGNHDALQEGAALLRLPTLADNVIVPHAPEVLDVAGIELLACPLLERHVAGDPTAWIPERRAGDRIRIVVAHGGVLDFAQGVESVNRIEVDRLLGKGVDYVALGDWHGTYRVNERCWYSGAPEATRFREQAPGNVLIVDIDAPGATPRVETVAVARSRWLRERVDLRSDDDVERMLARFDALEEKSWTLLRLELSGELSLAARERLDAGLAALGEGLAHLRLRGEGLSVAPTADDLARLEQEGYLGEVVRDLRADPEPVAEDALRLLYRILRERRPEDA